MERRDDRLVTSEEYFGEGCDTGEIFIVNAENEIKYIIDAPWAKDAIGNDVETYYRVENNTLVQVVEFDENTVFPVVADPTFWQVTKCVSAIALLIGGTILGAKSLIKAKQYIAAMGGLLSTAYYMLATTPAEWKAEAWKAAKNFILIVMDLDWIISACPGIKKLIKQLGI